VTTIFVPHDQEEALEVAQQVAVIDAGRIEQTGTPRRPLRATGQPVRDELRRAGLAIRCRLGALARHRAARGRRGGRDAAIIERVARVARVGVAMRIEAALGDGTPVPILATRQQADELELRAGRIVWLRVQRTRELAA
jgi:sulfate/thiosulfate transport system ATP-binding protein